jgi:hypothetical protein
VAGAANHAAPSVCIDSEPIEQIALSQVGRGAGDPQATVTGFGQVQEDLAGANPIERGDGVVLTRGVEHRQTGPLGEHVGQKVGILGPKADAAELFRTGIG